MVDSTSPGEDVGQDVPDAEDIFTLPDSYYKLTLLVETGEGVSCDASVETPCLDSAMCCRYEFFRDLSASQTAVSFGATQMTSAVSLGISDTQYTPTFASITLNFGILVGSAEAPPTTPEAGSYPFSGFEPTVRVSLHSKDFSSKSEGAQGTVEVAEWGSEPGDLFIGTIDGTLIQVAEKEDPLRCVVEGEFRILLPGDEG